MSQKNLILVLGDQLTLDAGALQGATPADCHVLMAELAEEASYVRHNRHKIALVFSAMRHFREELRAAGFTVTYYAYEEGLSSLADALDRIVREEGCGRLRCCQPGEYRVQQALEDWSRNSGVALDWAADNRFLCATGDFNAWAAGRKTFRMEHFYRVMRRRYQILLDEEGEPEGGRWNYDRENRAGWRGKHQVPARAELEHDAITREVLELVAAAFPDNPGDLASFNLAVTRAGAEEQLAFFIDHCLDRFGQYQDALAEESDWLYHSLVSMYLNIGLLCPLASCRQVEAAWRDGRCSLAAAEGFIRQVLGWREYVRGIYWFAMPEYGERNGLQAEQPLPAWFWDAEVDMRCLQRALKQSLDLGYAHHIQRLMVIGNFALLAGLSVREVCAWYLAVYVDAFEWVELPNTLGMALFADGGLMASKPYAASGRYIQRQGNHCASCRYRPDRVTGENACPYNSLYWAFINRHRASLEENPRMSLALRNWDKKPARERESILQWAQREGDRLLRVP
ncbi:cryptochrome/photolyase family protein [Seongchinamella sediminis]|uniref:Cryptochrome/photolyase family protein n=1 Tax=Seongchinamella sediminis TaxID=2283635 RepID=A0A3L7DZ11_9GAMM|nr:cryptochrome/photolyase family protein [Seongchinamella sediminis]RLQ21780.1 cryptochrome/photolyase family protein [Seongchinamella sediminis]